MNEPPISGFYAYPATPLSVGEVVREAVAQINGGGIVQLKTWEECRVGGKLIINEICSEINKAQFFCADLTGVNANVMFELGYAIARNKRIWLTIDRTLANATKEFEQLRILTTVGHQPSTNSGSLLNAFYQDRPYEDIHATVFDSYIKPNLITDSNLYLVYLQGLYQTEANVKISERIEKLPIARILDDPNESAIQTLVWYGMKLFSAAAVVCHLGGPAREASKIHIARQALAAGIAFGFDKLLLMLTEGEFLAPLDYRDLLRHYQTAAEAKKYLESWIAPLEEKWNQQIATQSTYISQIKLASELKNLRIGEYIAENEADNINEYFVQTVAYRAALDGKQSIFVGRKGSGKSANFLALVSAFQSDPRNLVCVIKPVAYELEGIVSLLGRYKEKDEKSYAVESLWKFLLVTEIANSVAKAIEQRPSQAFNNDERILLELLDANDYLRKDFSVRLEQCVDELHEQVAKLKTTEPKREQSRLAVSEAIHENVLGELRRILGRVLRAKKRVAVLIDNLDKAWDKQTDITTYSNLLLGLLASVNKLTADFHRSANNLDSVDLSIAIFLRSDIFYQLMVAAREPDKIGHTVLNWQDEELLLRVLEERFLTFHDNSVSVQEMWNRYFCSTVQNLPTSRYFLDRILKRPRDLLFFVKAAMETAVNRRHGRIEEGDIIEAEKQYSQFALSTVVVENVVALPNIESAIYEFAGMKSVIDWQEITHCMRRAKVDDSAVSGIITQLCMDSFLGVEISLDNFRFAEDPAEYKKLEVLATRFRENGGAVRYKINKAFWSYLEIQE